MLKIQSQGENEDFKKKNKRRDSVNNQGKKVDLNKVIDQVNLSGQLSHAMSQNSDFKDLEECRDLF